MYATFCRIKGYTGRVEKQEDDILHLVFGGMNRNFPFKTENIERGIYIAQVSMSEVDCIWKQKDYYNVEVLYGKLKVTKDEVATIKNTRNTKYIKKGFFAVYNGKEYINVQGINNNYRYRLLSYDIDSQEEGFIMDIPGRFEKVVPPEKIEAAYHSYTWCIYNGLKVIANNDRDGILTLEQYDRNDYPDKVYEDFGFDIRLTRYMKDVSVNDSELESIWLEFTPHKNFKHLKMEPVAIKGTIPL